MGEDAKLRVPPHSLEAEQGVLGGLLLDNRAFDVVGSLLQAADFYRLEHRTIWANIERMVVANRPADVVTVFDAMHTPGDDDGGRDLMRYLNSLAQSVASAANIKRYAEIVRGRSLLRRLINIGMDLVGGAYGAAADEGAVQALVDAAALQLLDLRQLQGDGEPQVVSDLLPVWLDRLERRAQGENDAIATGLRDVDDQLDGGLRAGELVVLGARPSMGKSAFALTLVRNVAQRGAVAVFSMEDAALMLVTRQVAAIGRVNLADLRNPERARDKDLLWSRVVDGVDGLRGLPIYIDDKPALTAADVRRKALQVRRRVGDKLSLVVVDYLQLMDAEGDTRHRQLDEVAKAMKRLAKELAVPVMLLSQLNREADKANGPPGTHHLRDSGGIEEAADVIGLLWREARAKQETPENKHRAQIEFTKNKNGRTGTVPLFFDGATQRFEDAHAETY
jgi:replicative DNA helicase